MASPCGSGFVFESDSATVERFYSLIYSVDQIDAIEGWKVVALPKSTDQEFNIFPKSWRCIHYFIMLVIMRAHRIDKFFHYRKDGIAIFKLF
ncbi:MAG: hypothetical protein A3F74_18100 [Betaproteobacteria bacterium RIFCSPLOWO2_12_FULL_62_58]|nr:MAG: hypothetical protein A3F74_18100 [Betaproteobacteria bacterium RIFCSPLOWO2_12_FULL_62_58]